MLIIQKVGKPGIWILAILLLVASLGRGDVRSGRADVGAIPIVPPGTTLQTMEPTPVQMVSETVQIDVRLATEGDAAMFSVHPFEIPYGMEWLPAVAEVQANFNMYNPTQEDIELITWFPLAGTLDDSGLQGQIGPIRVSVDGQQAGTNQVELPNPVRADLPAIPWATFPVRFPSEKEIEIQVSYLLPPQLEPGDNVGMNFTYIYQTGASWAGSIGRADLDVSLPYPASAETIGEMPDGGSVDGNLLRWTWLDLEPSAEDDFKLRLLQPANWEAIEQGRAVVRGDDQNGEAWLALGKAYRRAVHSKGLRLDRNFGAHYLPLASEAFQKAIEYLPENAQAHVGLAEMTFVPLFSEWKENPAELQKVLDKLALAERLESERPAERGELTVEVVRFYLEIYQEALLTPTPSATTRPTATKPAATLTPAPSATPLRIDTPTAIPPTSDVIGTAEQSRSPENLYGPGLAVGIILIVVLYFSLRRRK